MPHYLRYSNCVFQIEDTVPPPSGHKHGLSCLLNELIDLDHVAVLLPGTWQQVHEVVDGLVVLSCNMYNMYAWCT